MASLILFLSTFLFYLRRVSPTLYGGDTGEFIVSSFVLGLPHAPGFPVLNLVTKAAHLLIPFGSIAYRTNLFSALMGAMALVLFWKFLSGVLETKDQPWIPLPAVVGLGITPIFIDQSIVVEAFGLNLVFLIAILGCLHRAYTQAHDNFLFLASFLLGLGLGNHQTIVFVAPLLVLCAWRSQKRNQLFQGLLLFGLLGLSVYLYLPIRAGQNPPVNFGDPEWGPRLWAVLTRKEFGSLSLHPAAVPFWDAKLLFQQIHSFWERGVHQIGWTGMVGVGVGLVLGIRSAKYRWVVGGGLFGWLVCGLGFELLSNLSPGSAVGQWRLERFFLIPLFSLFVLLSVGLKQRVVFLSFISLFLIERVWAGPAFPDLRTNKVFHNFSISALRSIPKDAMVFIDRVLFDEPTSALLVATEIHQKRRDVKWMYRPGTLFSLVYGEDFLALSWEDRARRQRLVEEELVRQYKGPLAFLAFEKAHSPFRNPVLNGFVYQNQGTPLDPALFGENWALVSPGEARDYPRRLMAVHTPYFLAKAYFEQNQREEGQAWLDRSLAAGRDMAWLAANAGGLWIQGGDLDQAKQHYQRAVQQDAYFYQGYFGLGFCELKQKNYDEAIQAYHTATRLDPKNPDAYYMLGVAYTFAGQKQKAREPWKMYLKLAPQGAQADTIRGELQT